MQIQKRFAIPVNISNFRHPDENRDPDFPLVCQLKAWVFRRDDGIRNEFSALIIAKMAKKICESDPGFRRDDGI